MGVAPSRDWLFGTPFKARSLSARAVRHGPKSRETSRHQLRISILVLGCAYLFFNR